ncbi:hypothetical protein FRC08_011013 [Ceratobasidium sp. 394]|nr:hypothetical protein FRC08_011013 [Ceratobasidium sp. 394]
MVTWLRVQTKYGAHIRPDQDPDRHNWRKSYSSKPNHVQQTQFVRDAIAAHERIIISVIGQDEYTRLGKRPESDGGVSILASRPENATDLP